MAGQVSDAANALALARHAAEQAGLNPGGYIPRTSVYADGWWFRFEAQAGGGRIPSPAQFSVRVSRSGETEVMGCK